MMSGDNPEPVPLPPDERPFPPGTPIPFDPPPEQPEPARSGFCALQGE